MKKSANLIAMLLWTSYFLAVIRQADGFSAIGAIILFPLSVFPHAINHILIGTFRSNKALAILMTAQIGFAFWFYYLYVWAFYISLDALSALALVIVGIYAFPVMLILWIGAKICENRSEKRLSY